MQGGLTQPACFIPKYVKMYTDMIKYVERKNTDSMKWDGLENTFGADGLLPLWVADMDFRIDEHIIRAMHDYVEMGLPGYYKVPGSYYEAFIDWEKNEHGYSVQKEWIRFSPGIVVGFHIAIQVLTKPGDHVLISTPVYYPFSNAIKNNDRIIVGSELVNKDGCYHIDFEDFESKIRDNDIKAFILCSPHNPVCRVWTEEELKTMLDICRKYNVPIISDEIHQDLVFESSRHVPTLSLAEKSDRIIMFAAASKAFNIAGLQNSIVVIPNEKLREEWDAFMICLRINQGNALGYVATEAAFRYGKDWLREAKAVIMGNYEYICEEFSKKLPKVVMTPLEGTYLAWADFGAYLSADEIQPFMQDKCKLAFDYGPWFGGDRSGTFVRINLATSRENIEDMCMRIVSNMETEG